MGSGSCGHLEATDRDTARLGLLTSDASAAFFNACECALHQLLARMQGNLPRFTVPDSPPP
jgi:hypothetical protein